MFLTASLARLVRTGDSSASCAANAQHVGAVSLKAGPHEAVQPGRSDPVLGLTHRASGEFRGEAQVDAGAHRRHPDLAWREDSWFAVHVLSPSV